MRSRLSVLAALALLAGCRPDRPKLPSLPAAFATIPMPPKPEYVGQSGSEDALMFTFRTPVFADSVTSYYTKLFAADTAYHVEGSNAGAAGEHAFYVEYKKRPMWIRIRPEAGNEGAIVELTGAVIAPTDTMPVDTSHMTEVHGTEGPRLGETGPAPQRSGSSMSSNRNHRR